MILCAVVSVVASLEIPLSLSYACLLVSFILLCVTAGRNTQIRVVTLTFVGVLFLFTVGNAINVFAWQLDAGLLSDKLPTLLSVTNMDQVLTVYRALTYCVSGVTMGLLIAPQHVQIQSSADQTDSHSTMGMTRVPLVMYGALIVSALCHIARSWDIWRFVDQSGYVSYYVDYSTRLPTIIVYLGNALDVIYFTVLAIVRRGRALVLPTIVYLGASAFTMMTGKRGQFMIPLLVVLVFFFHGAFARSGAAPLHLARRVIVILLFVFVPLMLLMQVLFTYRTGVSVGLGPGDFVVGQGGSIATVGYVILLGSGLPDKPYAFGSILSQLRGYVCRGDICDPIPNAQTVERAMMTPQLGDTLTYAISPHAYLSGYGFGSSFVAELLAEFGLSGVFLGSLFYGLLLVAVSRLLSSESVISVVVALLVAQRLFFSPRAGFSDFLLGILSTQNLLWLSCVWLILHLAPRRKQISAEKSGSV